MNKKHLFFLIFFLYLQPAYIFSQDITSAPDNEKFWKTMTGRLPEFRKVFKKYKKFRLEIIYTKIDRKEDNSPVFTEYHYGDKVQYFYPASIVKLPMSVFTLEKIYNTMKDANMEHLLQFDSAAFCNDHKYQNYFHSYYRVKKDETFSYIAHKFHKPVEYLSKLNPGVRTDTIVKENSLLRISNTPSLMSFRELLTEMLMFSSNEAYNKLFEFATPDFINTRLFELGYKNSAITKRLMACTNEWQKKSQVFSIHKNDSVFYSMENSKKWHDDYVIEKEGTKVGKKYITADDSLVKEPREFRGHNTISLGDLHLMMLRLVFMENIPDKRKFSFSRFEQRFLLRMLGMSPRELERLRDVNYENLEDGYTNFLMNGSSRENFKSGLRIINITGQAYGFSTDCAYIFDTGNPKIEFMLSMRIYTNKDGVLGDDKYEYEEIAMPLMEQFGKVIYSHELKRARGVVPNLNYHAGLFK